MLKALMPVPVYSIGILLKKDSFNNSTMSNMVAISLGVAISAYVTLLNLFGYGLAFLGVGYYNHSKLQALKMKEAQKKSAMADEEGGKLMYGISCIDLTNVAIGSSASLSVGVNPTFPPFISVILT
ncbi:hypothetical protein ACS0TY_027441 [Phlomoides rotata]